MVGQSDTASILMDVCCKECGWPVISACCNGNFKVHADARNFDWWYYCSNKGCINHRGEGVFQDDPEWVIDND
jgi:hypothetical protein